MVARRPAWFNFSLSACAGCGLLPIVDHLPLAVGNAITGNPVVRLPEHQSPCGIPLWEKSERRKARKFVAGDDLERIVVR